MENILSNAVKETVILGSQSSISEGDRFHIAMTGTRDYIPRIGILIWSILENNTNMKLSFHILVNGLPMEERKNLEYVARSSSCLIYVHIMDDEVFQPLVFGGKTAVFFYRFLVGDIIGKLADRILYLDGDMLCIGSLQKLQDIDMGNSLAAVVSDRREKKQMHQMGTGRFFNAGMMLIHADSWQKENITSQVICSSLEALHHINRKGKYKGWHGASYNDQNLLNVLLDGRLIFLPHQYNYIYVLALSAFNKKQPYNEEYRKQIIIHFAGIIKSWHSMDWVQCQPVVKAYMNYQKESPWIDAPLRDPETYSELHQQARYYRVNWKFVESIKWYIRYYKNKL